MATLPWKLLAVHKGLPGRARLVSWDRLRDGRPTCSSFQAPHSLGIEAGPGRELRPLQPIPFKFTFTTPSLLDLLITADIKLLYLSCNRSLVQLSKFLACWAWPTTLRPVRASRKLFPCRGTCSRRATHQPGRPRAL